jgi:hypothetical protein
MVNYCGCGCGLLSLIVCPSQRHNTCLSQPQPPSTPTKPSMPRGLTTLGVVSSCSCGTMRDLQGQSLGETIEEENHFTTTIQGQQGYCPLLIFSQVQDGDWYHQSQQLQGFPTRQVWMRFSLSMFFFLNRFVNDY